MKNAKQVNSNYFAIPAADKVPTTSTCATFETLFHAISYFSETRPNHPALLDASNGRTVTYAELLIRVNDLAGKMKGYGVGAGDCVVVDVPRSALMVELLLAVSYLGALAVAYMSSRNPELALEAVRNAIEPKLVISTRQTKRSRTVRSNDNDIWIDAAQLECASAAEPFDYHPGTHTVLYLNESSGSTSSPKLAPATHEAVIANTIACIEAFGLTQDDIHLCSFSSHAHESFARAIYTGATAVLIAASIAEDPNAYIDAIVRYRVTCLMANPTSIRCLADLSSRPPGAYSLRFVEAGGAPTPTNLRRHVQDKFGARIMPVWGSTETTGVAIAPHGQESKIGSVGMALPGYKVQIVDENGIEVPPNCCGELVVSGPAVVNGYINADNFRLANKTFRTGDRAFVDNDGSVFVVGRIANEFKVAGVAVSAERIEQALLRNEYVSDAAVLPIANPVYSYVPAALVVPRNFDYKLGGKPLEKLLTKSITRTLEEHLSEPFFEFPTRLQWVDALPRNSVEKLDRRRLPDVYDEQPLGRMKLRQGRIKRLVRAIRSSDQINIWRMALRNPFGLLRLIFTVLRGDKAK